jgi:hypothetical protein
MHTSSGANCVFVSVRNSTILHNSEHRYFFVDQAEKWSLVSVKIAIATAIWYNKEQSTHQTYQYQEVTGWLI